MSVRGLLKVALSAALVLGVGLAAAEEPQEAARRHFKSGVGLFQNSDFKGALAEFEASQRHLPSASTLQNIALCLTKLHRYIPALEALDRIKTEHWAALGAEDRAAVDASIKELSQLVGTVTVRVTPPGAQVSINGRAVAPEALARAIRLSSGEYLFRAEAPNHAALERTETIAGGDERVIELQLQPQSAELDIQASDQEAAIAIDGQPVAYGSWKGPVMAGERLVQVYKPGYRSFASRIPVKAGDRLELRPLLGPPEVSRARGGMPAPMAPAIEEAPQRGWYGLFAASSLVPLMHPDGFESKDAWTGAAYGLRLGYRFWKPVAFEAMVDGGTQRVGPGEYKSGGSDDQRLAYELNTGRVGGNVRLLAGGRVARFSAVFGVGAVSHQVKLGDKDGRGTDSYLLIETGAQFNVGRVLLEGCVLTYLEGVSAVKAGEERMYTERTVVPQLGIGFRVGYGQWGRW